MPSLTYFGFISRPIEFLDSSEATKLREKVPVNGSNTISFLLLLTRINMSKRSKGN